MKKRLIVFVSFICVFTLGFSSTCFAETSSSSVQNNNTILMAQEQLESKITLGQKQSFQKMSIRQKEARALAISNGYSVGEKLSDDDASFLLLHAQEEAVTEEITALAVDTPRTRTSGTNAYIYANKYGVTAVFNPQVWVTTTLSTGKYRGKNSLEIWGGKSKIKTVKLITSHTAYGIVGGAGIFVLYTGSLSTGNISSQKDAYNMDLSKSYPGYVIWRTYTYSYAKISATDGTFDINSAKYDWYW